MRKKNLITSQNQISDDSSQQDSELHTPISNDASQPDSELQNQISNDALQQDSALDSDSELPSPTTPRAQTIDRVESPIIQHMQDNDFSGQLKIIWPNHETSALPTGATTAVSHSYSAVHGDASSSSLSSPFISSATFAEPEMPPTPTPTRNPKRERESGDDQQTTILASPMQGTVLQAYSPSVKLDNSPYCDTREASPNTRQAKRLRANERHFLRLLDSIPGLPTVARVAPVPNLLSHSVEGAGRSASATHSPSSVSLESHHPRQRTSSDAMASPPRYRQDVSAVSLTSPLRQSPASNRGTPILYPMRTPPAVNLTALSMPPAQLRMPVRNGPGGLQPASLMTRFFPGDTGPAGQREGDDYPQDEPVTPPKSKSQRKRP